MALSVKNLKAGYGGAVAIRNLTTTIPKGRITALIGPNGSCKSTLLKTLARLLPPMAGEATVDGQSIYGLSAHARSHASCRCCPSTSWCPRASRYGRSWVMGAVLT